MSIQDDDIGVLRSLCPNDSLVTLVLAETGVTDAGVESLRGMTIRQLFLGSCQITDASAACFCYLHHLTDLHLEDTQIGDGTCQAIVEIETLEHLEIPNTRVTDDGAALTMNLPRLSRLNLGYNDKISDVTLERLSNKTSLREFLLKSTGITDAGLRHLEKSALIKLEVGGNSAVTDVGINSVAQIKSLVGLDINDGNSVSNNAIAQLSALPALCEKLIVSRTSITDDCIKDLIKHPFLKLLDVKNTQISEHGVERLREALPQCTIWSDHGTRLPRGTEYDQRVLKWTIAYGGKVSGFVTANGIQTLVSPKEPIEDSSFYITTISIDDASQLMDTDLQDLSRLRSITSLVFGGMDEKDHVTVIARLLSIRELKLGGTAIDNVSLRILTGLPTLSNLLITNTGITDTGLLHLKAFPSLYKLTLTSDQITTRSIPDINSAAGLRFLRIDNANVNTLALLPLLKNLETLELQKAHTSIEPAHIDDLHKAMPHCRIIWHGGTILPERL
ncbi:MAG: hypothetical protein KDB01_25115 [Planctomycetaceae bacterium]|nr:hypothetical protein [Planctomycetaceae bacterium]